MIAIKCNSRRCNNWELPAVCFPEWLMVVSLIFPEVVVRGSWHVAPRYFSTLNSLWSIHFLFTTFANSSITPQLRCLNWDHPLPSFDFSPGQPNKCYIPVFEKISEGFTAIRMVEGSRHGIPRSPPPPPSGRTPSHPYTWDTPLFTWGDAQEEPAHEDSQVMYPLLCLKVSWIEMNRMKEYEDGGDYQVMKPCIYIGVTKFLVLVIGEWQRGTYFMVELVSYCLVCVSRVWYWYVWSVCWIAGHSGRCSGG